MKRTLKRLLPLLALVCIAVVFWKTRDQADVPPPAGPPPFREVLPPVLPALLPSRAATPESPFQSWERLLAADGSPAEDRSALADIVTNYLQGSNPSTRPALGTNEEITRALTDRRTLEDSAIPPSHPAIASGQLVDRWGSPWFFHQQSSGVIEVRSAGPDRKLFTADDLK
jgi:hypothetical protein